MLEMFLRLADASVSGDGEEEGREAEGLEHGNEIGLMEVDKKLRSRGKCEGVLRAIDLELKRSVSMW